MMSSNTGHSVQSQISYISQWFCEWSEMQRDDFLPILAQKFYPGSYVNGLVAGIDGLACKDDRPPSLFQCRIKLFREWSENWGQAEKDQLLSMIRNVDENFIKRFEEEVKSRSGIEDLKPTTVTEDDDVGGGENISPTQEVD